VDHTYITSYWTSVACAIGPSVTSSFVFFPPQDMAIFFFNSQKALCWIRLGFIFLVGVRNFAQKKLLKVCIDFLNSQIWKEIMLELNGKPSSVTSSSTDFSFQNLVFWNLFKFSSAEITLKSISPTLGIQILPNKFHWILLIKSFPTTPKAHSNSSEILSCDLI
jgi:hypothetical protein